MSSCSSSFANNRLLYTGVKNQMVALMRHVDTPAQGLLASLVQDINLSLGMEGHTQRQFAEYISCRRELIVQLDFSGWHPAIS